jgi:hypothetical protein
MAHYRLYRLRPDNLIFDALDIDVADDEAAIAAGRVAVWHPTIRTAGNTLEQSAPITAAGLATTLTLRR